MHPAHNVEKVTSDGIEPPLSDLESEVLPLHHEALLVALLHNNRKCGHRGVRTLDLPYAKRALFH